LANSQLVLGYVMSSHNSSLMYKKIKIVSDVKKLR